jgi:hypothetical protein
MISYIAFLRGINISGKNKVPMGELKSTVRGSTSVMISHSLTGIICG